MLFVWPLSIHTIEDIITKPILKRVNLFGMMLMFYLFLNLYDACAQV